MIRYLLLLALATRLTAQETMIRQVADTATDTHVEVLALFTQPSAGGYLPVRVKIANNVKSSQSVHLDFTSQFNYNEALTTRSSFDFTADAGKTVTRDIMVPVCPAGDRSGTITLSVMMSGSLGTAGNSMNGEFGQNQPAVLLSETLFTPYGSALDSEASKRFSGRGSASFAGKFDPKQLPDEWLAFSGYDSVVMTDNDWTNIPPGGRNAILSWVRLGGQLVIFTETGDANAKSLGLPEESGFGIIKIKTQSPTKGLVPYIFQEITRNSVRPQVESLHSDFMGGWPLQLLFGGRQFQYSLFIMVLILFGILVGPVNLFVFAKAGQRHKLFITTPIISLVASLILIGLIIVQDGFGGSGIRQVLMEVRPDGGINAAYVHQEQFSRTGVLTGSRFTIPTPVQIAPLPLASSRWTRFTTGYNAKGNYQLQPGDGKIEASGDWFQSRSEQGQLLSAVVSTRGRIEATDTPGSYLSTFEFPIDTLYRLDESGRWEQAQGITAGKRFTFSPVAPVTELLKVGKDFSRRNQTFFEAAMKRPNHFVAVTSHAPGIDTNPSVRWNKTRTVITGPIIAP